MIEMGFFKKKKDSSLHTLSESDIQKRLYGNLKPADKKTDAVPHKFKTIPTPETPAKSYAESVSAAQKLTPKVSPEKPSYSSYDKDDLFAHTDNYSDSVDKTVTPDPVSDEPRSSAHISEAEKIKEESIMARLGEIAEKEEAQKEKEFKAAQAAPVKIKTTQSSASVKPAPLGGSFNKTQKKKSGLNLGAVLVGFISVAAKGFIAVLGVFKVINLGNPKIRTALYWLLGAGVLVSLFFGVHLLNVQREAAMKSPIKKKEVSAPKVERPAAEAAVVTTELVRSEQRTATPVNTSSNASIDNSRTDSSEPRNESVANESSVEPARVESTAANASVDNALIETQSSGRYVIQVATYAGPNDANRMREQFADAGIPVFVQSLSRPSGKVYYSLFLGRFKSYSEAQSQFEKFKGLESSRPFKDAFIRTLGE